MCRGSCDKPGFQEGKSVALVTRLENEITRDKNSIINLAASVRTLCDMEVWNVPP